MAGNRPWLEHYPPGVNSEIDADYPACLPQMLGFAMQQFGEMTALECDGHQISFAQLDALSSRLANWLMRLGLDDGARIAIMLPNILHQPICALAVLRSGFVCVNVNPFYTSFELQHQLRDSGAQVLFVMDDCLATVMQLTDCPGLQHVVVGRVAEYAELADGGLSVVSPSSQYSPLDSAKLEVFADIVRKSRDVCGSLPVVSPGEIALLQYTGGTTGISKGAVLSHRNLAANLLQYKMWLKSVLDKLDGRQPVFLCPMPLYHISAFTLGLLFGILNGFLIVLIPNPRNTASIFDAFDQNRVSIFPAVNTMLAAMNAHPRMHQTNFADLVLTISGGAAVHRVVAERWKELTGSTVIEGYGLSETSPIVSINRPASEEFSGHAGFPAPSTDVITLDDEGYALPVGAAGEIAVRGPQVMREYWCRPVETKSAFTPDGFFKTGDMGIIEPDGAIRLLERKKDMILVSGFNVYPNEVEAAVAACPGVLECAAVAVPDERSSEAVKLFVVRSDPSVCEADIMAYCRSRLASYKCPKSIEFRNELPKSAIGKILRRQLRSI